MRISGLICIYCLVAAGSLPAQNTVLPLGSIEETLIQRMDISSGIHPLSLHSAIRPYTRSAVVGYALHVDSTWTAPGTSSQSDLHYIFRNNNEWLGEAGNLHHPRKNQRPRIEIAQQDPRYTKSKKTLLGLYPTPANFIEVNTPDFHLRINPLLQVKYGAQKNHDQPYFLNQRGVELRAGFDDRVFVYFNVLENQAQFADYVHEQFEQTQSIQGIGFVKRFSGFGVKNGYDFLLSQSQIGFNLSPHIGAQLGYGRNFIGNGYRSMLLSDIGYNYLHLKLNWKVWKFHYQNLFAELSTQSANAVPDGTLVPKKYLAAHYLSYNITPALHIGLYEAVVLSRENHFEFNYLNPVIFYRAVEHGLGSPDNVLLGINGSWNFLKHFQLYGQFLLDEFKFAELLAKRSGWWGNKFSQQIGLKYINAFDIDHLDLQIEYNQARPFTYSHYEQAEAYAHFRQPLAHPLGANFREWILLGRWQALPKLLVQGRFIQARTGTDTGDTNWGSNILLSNNTYTQEYGNTIGQGIPTTIRITGLELSYTLAHNVFLDVQFVARTKHLEYQEKQVNTFFGSGIRMNLPFWRQDF